MKLNPGTGAMPDLSLRVSVATYNQVIFPHPEDETIMLALERKATSLGDGSVSVRAQPFGGGIRILNPAPLQRIVGKLQFDSKRSKQEQDFRILIPPSKWEPIKQYCLQRLADEDNVDLEAEPDRELVEEFMETMKVKLSSRQYTVQPLGFVIENNPVRTTNEYARGQLTVHLYRIFRTQINDSVLCRIMLSISQLYSDQALEVLAANDFEQGNRGRMNTILTLPLNAVRESYLALAPETRYQQIIVENHTLDESVLAVLEDVDVPQYQRL
jgi:hypothetical protein